MVVPFEAVIDSDTEIKNYAEYLYEQAGGAVLSWIIEGAVKYLKTECHIDIPKAVKKATEQYRSENDWLNNYLSECCEKGKDYEILTGELYKDFLHYCEQTGEEKKSQQAFGRALTNSVCGKDSVFCQRILPPIWNRMYHHMCHQKFKKI